jgi:hypothetical protein
MWKDNNPSGPPADPTGLPVRFAFPPSSGDENKPAQPVTWLPGAWEDHVAGTEFCAYFPLGPAADGGALQLPAGAYDVWSQIQAGSETPRLFAGVLRVF